MPDFTIRGNPGAVRARATTTSDKGQLFYDTGEALSKIDTSGWTGRAADHFRDAHGLEPDRWWKAGNGFRTAGQALTTYADALEHAQEVAVWAQGEWQRGESVTEQARSSYDAEVADARQKLADGVYSSLTIHPFTDPGQPIRDSALAEFATAQSTLENAAAVCAGQVRTGCADAPEEPSWWESGLRFVGGIFEGAGEAIWDLLTISPFGVVNMVTDSWKLATGELTPEELAKKYQLSFETVAGMWEALQEDPLEFGVNLGKALLDWDTWADDPARALGHLVPDAVAAVLTGGAGAAATRGTKGGLDALDALSDISRLSHVDDLADLGRLDELGDLGRLDDLNRLDELGDLSRFDDMARFDDVPEAPQGVQRGLNDPDLDAWIDDVHAAHPELSRDGIRGLWDYTTDDGYTAMNGELRNPVPDPSVQARIDATNQGISQLPEHPGTSYRGTNLPDHVVNDIAQTGRYTDPAFSSSSLDPAVAERFIDGAKANPTRITVEGASGVDVRPFSAARGEAEILFPSNTEFEVVSNVVGPDGVRNLVLRELP